MPLRTSAERWPSSTAEGFDRSFILLLTFVGGILRTLSPELCAVEHFDEGVYASVWHSKEFGTDYPGAFFFSPPAMRFCIQCCVGIFPGCSWAPAVPGMLFGTLTIPAMWWLCRVCSGRCAAYVGASLVCFSDVHIAFSRTALTDVPTLFFLILSLATGLQALTTRRWTMSVVTGILIGTGWWFKYTGWLPLAVLWTGVLAWLALHFVGKLTGKKADPPKPPDRCGPWLGGSAAISRLVVLTIVAAGVFLPWILALQPHGGYSAVNGNHAGYVQQFNMERWQEGMASHLSQQLVMNGGWSAFGLLAGFLVAGLRRWFTERRAILRVDSSERFTWNGHDYDGCGPSRRKRLLGAVAPTLLVRFVVAAFAAASVALVLGSVPLLICLCVGAIAGLFLWPVTEGIFEAKSKADRGVLPHHEKPHHTGPFQHGCSAGMLQHAALMNPGLSKWIILAWLTGLLVATPFYATYPRLFLPLLAGLWAGAALGAGWWIEANLYARRLSVFRTVPLPAAPLRTMLRQAIAGAAVGLMAFAIWDQGITITSPAIQDQRAMQQAAAEVAIEIRQHLQSNGRDPQAFQKANDPKTFTASAVREELQESLTQVRPEEPGDTDGAPQPDQRIVIYVLAEPALLYHLHGDGLVRAPSANLDLAPARERAELLPTFLVVGPNAIRMEGILEALCLQGDRLRPVAEVPFRPSLIPALNLFSVRWYRDHPESREQLLRIYRIQDQLRQP